MIELSGKKVLVVGLGMSGAASARVAVGLGASVRVVDSSKEPLRAGMKGELERLGVDVALGVDVPESIERYDLLVASPGVLDRAAVLTAARRAGVRVISELELGYRLLEDHTMVAVTGTNGKTTTTRLIDEMLADGVGGARAITCGNIGNPLVGLYGQVGPDDVLIIEVSSFQLQNIESFHAKVAVALNVAPDHYDWHRDFEEYREAKMRIIENMLPEEYLVYNSRDESCLAMAAKARGITLGFGADGERSNAVWVEDGWIVAGPPIGAGKLLPVSELKLAGSHNVENVMAAAAASLALGRDPVKIREATAAFEGLEHRVEFVTEVSKVSFYNDSKATNPHAALHAIRSFDTPMVAIMGGRNKGLEFGEVAFEVCARMRDGRMRGLVLVGESAPELRIAVENVCREEADGHVVTAADVYDSVEKAYALSGGEGVVLFSPACASFDMFADYKDRGRVFKDSVSRFKESGARACGK